MRELPSEDSDNDEEGDLVTTKWLVEAIQKVKYQKQRTSFDRICSMVRQCHRIDKRIVKDELEKAVDKGLIVKVCFSGFFHPKSKKNPLNDNFVLRRGGGGYFFCRISKFGPKFSKYLFFKNGYLPSFI